MQAVFEIGSQFWVHKNLRSNFEELTKVHLSVTSEKAFYFLIHP